MKIIVAVIAVGAYDLVMKCVVEHFNSFLAIKKLDRYAQII
jgi:hypothetical protein